MMFSRHAAAAWGLYGLLACASAASDPECQRKIPLPPAMARFEDAVCARNTGSALQEVLNGLDMDYRDEEGETALFWAARMGMVEVAREMLQRGARIDVFNRRGDSLIEAAVSSRKLEMAALILQQGIHPDHASGKRSTALIGAAARGQTEMVHLLLDAGANPNGTDAWGQLPLHLACQGNHLDAALLLIQRGAGLEHKDRDEMTPLLRASMSVHLETMMLLLNHGSSLEAREKFGLTALSFVASRPPSMSARLQEAAELLLEAGAEVDAKDRHGRTPFELAASMKNYALLPLLARKGADIKGAEGPGVRALREGVSKRSADCVQAVLDCGVPPDCWMDGPGGDTALVRALGNIPIARMLLQHGANPNRPRTRFVVGNGIWIGAGLKGSDWIQTRTPLMLAAEMGSAEMAGLLLEHGARAELRDTQGRTAFDLAKMHGHESIAQMLAP